MKKLAIILLALTGTLHAAEGPSAFFDTDKSEILNEKQIREFATTNKDNIESVVVLCYADSRGSDEYNYKLAQRRCDAVVAILDAASVSTETLHIFGEHYPTVKEEGSDIEGRRGVNRRVRIAYRHKTVTKTVTKLTYKKNRISLLGGFGSYGLTQSTLVVDKSYQVDLVRALIGGLQYQRLITRTVSLGAFALSNGSFGASVGLDF